MTKKKISIIAVLGAALLLVIAYTQFTIFIVSPIGAVPKGGTFVISRLSKSNFVDSADAICERAMGGVSLLCRGEVLATVAQKAKIYLRLPYSEWLYLLSTNGSKYTPATF